MKLGRREGSLVHRCSKSWKKLIMIRLVVGLLLGGWTQVPISLPSVQTSHHWNIKSQVSPATVSTTKDHQFSGAWAGYICEAGDNGGEEGGAGSDEMLGWMGQWGQDAGHSENQRAGFSTWMGLARQSQKATAAIWRRIVELLDSRYMIYCFLLSGVVKAVHTPTKASNQGNCSVLQCSWGIHEATHLHYLGLGFCLR